MHTLQATDICVGLILKAVNDHFNSDGSLYRTDTEYELVVAVNPGGTFSTKQLLTMNTIRHRSLDSYLNGNPDRTRVMISIASRTEAQEFVAKQVREFDSKVHRMANALAEAKRDCDRYKTIASELGLHELKGE